MGLIASRKKRPVLKGYFPILRETLKNRWNRDKGKIQFIKDSNSERVSCKDTFECTGVINYRGYNAVNN